MAEAQKSRPSPGAALLPSQVIFTMPQMEQLCVKVRLGESEMKKLQVKQQARITIDSEDDIACTGTLEKIVFKADTVLAKHDETYMPKEVADKMGAAHKKHDVQPAPPEAAP